VKREDTQGTSIHPRLDVTQKRNSFDQMNFLTFDAFVPAVPSSDIHSLLLYARLNL
jgi:hypothetical protein